LHRFQCRCYVAGFVIELFDGDAARGLHRLKPVLRRWFLREPPIRNAMEQGCTGFNRCYAAGFVYARLRRRPAGLR
jgi:hypothetical protein